MRRPTPKNLLLSLALGTLVASTLAFQRGPRAFAPHEVRAPIGSSVDPRVAVLAPRPGTAPADHAIAVLAAQDRRFARGLALFDKDFGKAEGLGAPEMNADSCRACHQDPVIGGAGPLELNVSRHGYDGEDGTEPFQSPPDGQGLSKLFPPWVPGREEYDTATSTVFEQRQTPSILGAGRVDTIPAEVILANEDPDDADRDGIFGVARVLMIDGAPEVGRFGWKGQVPRLRDFVKDAMGGELGVTTPDDDRGFAMLSDDDGVLDPELNEKKVGLIHHFLDRLPAPKRVGSTDPAVAEGEALFDSVGCAICHIPALDSPSGPVPLYSNLLLHDVMPDDFRGMAEDGAGVGMFKTPPLWGCRDTAPYMHDGRGANLTEAILAHHGEAAGVVAEYQALTPAQRAAVLAFLEDL